MYNILSHGTHLKESWRTYEGVMELIVTPLLLGMYDGGFTASREIY